MTPPRTTGNCPRCDDPTADSRPCSPCSKVYDKQIARWLEDKPARLDPGEVLELAAELRLPATTVSKRISRIRRGQ